MRSSLLAVVLLFWTTAAFGFGIYDTANQVAPGVDLSWVIESQKNHPEIRRTISTATFYIEGATSKMGAVIPHYRNQECAATMAALRKAGIDIAYYVPTANRDWHSDFSTPPTVDQIHKAIDKITFYYPEVNIIYLDEVGLRPSNYLLVRDAAEYARSKGLEVDLGSGVHPLDDIYLNDIDYRLVLMEQFAVRILWRKCGTVYPDDACNPTPEPPNYTDYLGNLSWIPSAEWMGENFNLLTPVTKRALVFYLSVPFYPSPAFCPPLSWITAKNIAPYMEDVGWIWIAAQGANLEDQHLALVEALSSLPDQRVLITLAAEVPRTRR